MWKSAWGLESCSLISCPDHSLVTLPCSISLKEMQSYSCPCMGIPQQPTPRQGGIAFTVHSLVNHSAVLLPLPSDLSAGILRASRHRLPELHCCCSLVQVGACFSSRCI